GPGTGSGTRSGAGGGPRAVTGVGLLAYADRLAGDLAGVRRLLVDGPLGVLTGVHLLPFFVPFDGADAGFDPEDHTAVDPRLGTWDDVRALAGAGLEVTADLVVNHVSARSAEFRDWLARGPASPHDGMFLTFDRVFPDGAHEADLVALHRPRPGVPLTPYRHADGTRRLLWTTFAPTQVDLDLEHPAARAYLRRVLRVLADGGVRTVRLDAVGYAVKTAGSDSFMTPRTLEAVASLAADARALGLRVLVEVHAHHELQAAVAPLVDLVYDFALPPLLLHALGTGTVDRLARWLGVRPTNAVTVLDTHDGIGVVDAGPAGDRPGLLDGAEMAAVHARAAVATDGRSARASVVPAFAARPHQVNATFLDVLGGDVTALLLARCVQVLVPGEPQLYYVGLLGGRDDAALLARTGVGRDLNRHHYRPDEVAAALRTDVTRAQLGLAVLRRHPAFGGTFRWHVAGPAALVLEWRLGEASVVGTVDVTPGAPAFRVTATPSAATGPAVDARDVGALAALAPVPGRTG
ncbi:alpha-amylase family glycosyl hydrolase, partial [Cellulomonas endophytica]|uniref:alpha-amylase family glycosyl hydrolase n=1 Tax=Cellulomonas endophytica TaxID=2494735 RepID=UPI001F0B9B07